MPKNGKILVKAINDVLSRQESMRIEQNELLKKISANAELKRMDHSGECLVNEIIKDAKIDLELIEKLNPNIRAYKKNLHSTIKFNKMNEVLKGSLAMMETDEDSLQKILDGNLPFGYNNQLALTLNNANDKLTQSSFWGTSKSTFTSGALLSTYFTLADKTIQDIYVSSNITHLVDLPVEFELPNEYRFTFKSLNLENGLQSQKFGYVHSGYAFGGSRFQNKMYLSKKINTPEDCSSWVANITGYKHVLSKSYQYTTLDQLYSYRSLTNKGLVPEEWKMTEEPNMVSRYNAIDVEDLQIGDVIFHRTYKDGSNRDIDSGIGGHSGIIVDKNTEAGKFVVINANREMPALEGFSLSHFSISDKKFTGVLRVNDDKLAAIKLPPALNILSEEEFTNIEDLTCKLIGLELFSGDNIGDFNNDF